MSQTATRIDQIGVAVVPAGDQERATAFHAGTLGLEQRVDVPFRDPDTNTLTAVETPGA